jgi:4-amino-4-deoxy-L-arabinose transferase-like glycosyltransferase
MLTRLSTESRRFYYWLAGAAALGLGVRLLYAVHDKWNQTVTGDAGYFYYQARAISQGHWFIDPYRWQWLHQGYHPGAEHPPLYTLFLTIPDLLGFGTFREAMIASAILGTCTVVVIGLVGRVIGGNRLGIVAAVLAAIYANLWINDGLVVSETMAALMIAALVLYAYKFWKQPTWANAALLGLFSGLAALTRAEVVLLFPLIAVPLVWKARGLDLKPRLQRLGLIAIVAALPVLPWVGYNLTRFDHPVTLSTGADFTLANTNCATTYYGPRVGWWDARCLANRYTNKGDESTVALHFRNQGLKYIDHHKGRVPVVVAARIGRMWELYGPIQKLPWDDFEQGRGPRWITKLALGSYYALAILAIVGLVMLRRKKTIIYPLISLAVISTVAAVLAFGNTRYRTPAEVAIVLAAAVPLTALLDRWRPPHAAAGPAEELREPDPPVNGDGTTTERVGDVVGAPGA